MSPYVINNLAPRILDNVLKQHRCLLVDLSAADDVATAHKGMPKVAEGNRVTLIVLQQAPDVKLSLEEGDSRLV
jgi:hypothetical protein